VRASISAPSEQLVTEIRDRLDALAVESPNNSIRTYLRAADKINKE